MKDRDADFSTSLDLFLSMKDNHTGFIDISGVINNKGSINTLARTYSFSYHAQKNNMIHLTDINISKKVADDSPDQLMERFIFNIDKKNGKYIKMEKIDNGFLISNLYSPTFICIS